MDVDGLELLYKLPDTDVEAFGCFQNFIYTAQVSLKSGDTIPDFSVLFRLWKLAREFQMTRLQTDILDCMVMRRQLTGYIPSVEHIKLAWEDTEEGCALRIKLIDWMAEYSMCSVSPPYLR